ncbi:MAG: DUF454 domain-containing protein [Proteobacteria bacterium]|jgi:Uncharacterized protein conserved in bacteria|nr:MAG: DUF454 domain-containing protein [Pseudomonadota bacterium]
MKRSVWLLLGLLSTACGIIGAVLPLVPTTPFLLVAAFAFARSSPRLHTWLMEHRHFGPLVHNWQQNGSIDRKAKYLSVAVMAGMLGLSWFSGVATWILLTQAAVLTVVAAWILTRPDAPRSECRDVAGRKRP